MVAYYHCRLAESLTHTVVECEFDRRHSAYYKIGEPVEQIVQETVLPLPLAPQEHNQNYRSADDYRDDKETERPRAAQQSHYGNRHYTVLSVLHCHPAEEPFRQEMGHDNHHEHTQYGNLGQ